MKNWQKSILLPTSFFILGIIAGDRLYLPPLFLLLACGLVLALVVAQWVVSPGQRVARGFTLPLTPSPQGRGAGGRGSATGPVVRMCMLFFLLGWARADIAFHDSPPEGFSKDKKQYELAITGPVRFLERGIRAPAEILPQKIPTHLRIYSGTPKLLSGDIVHVWGKVKPVGGFRNPGAPDTVRQRHREGVFLATEVDSADEVVTGEKEGWHPTRFIERWRYRLRDRFVRLSSLGDMTSAGGLIRGITIGDISGIGEDVMEDFRRSGLAHLLSISGQHVGLVALIFFFLFGKILRLFPKIGLWIPLQRISWGLTLVPVTIYVGLAGFPVSALRALILVLFFVAAFLIGRTRDSWSALALAALALLAVNPSALFTISFQLSFMAAAVLIWTHRKFSSRQDSRQKTFWRELVAASIAISIVTAPLIAYYFASIPLAGVLANLVAIPYFGFVLLPTSFLMLVSDWLSPVALYAADGLIIFSRLIASLDFTLPISLRPIQVVLCYVGLGIGVLALRTGRPNLPATITTVLAALIILLGGEYACHLWQQKGKLTLTLFDVGQGDAMLLQFPDRSRFLIDGGGFYIPKEKRKFDVADIGEAVLLPYFARHGISRLDGIILTHPHPEHYEGLIAVIRNLKIKNFYWNGDRFPDKSFDELLSELRKHNVPMTRVDAGSPPIEKGGAVLQWLVPQTRLPTSSLNNRSLVARIDYGNSCFLLTGDIEVRTEQELVAHYDLKCDLLKVPHHGSKTSSTAAFLEEVDPEVAIVSAGRRNPFGHPSPKVVERYKEMQIPLRRTDRDGAITVISDGKKNKVIPLYPSSPTTQPST